MIFQMNISEINLALPLGTAQEIFKINYLLVFAEVMRLIENENVLSGH